MTEGDIKARSFISFSGTRSGQLESMYADLIATANKKIRILTPYLNPTPPLLAAMKAAALRGVEIEIVTNLKLIGDDFPRFVVDLIEASSNCGACNVPSTSKIYTWNQPQTFHPKVVQIDGETLVIGSVNLSKRSFVKDVENGNIFRGASANSQFDAIFENGILPNVSLVTKPRDLTWFQKMALKFFGEEF